MQAMADTPIPVHPFFAQRPCFYHRKTASPPRIGFLDFSAEIRNRIYEYAVLLPFVIRNDPVKRKNLKLRYPHW